MLCPALSAAEVDATRLPAPSPTTIDFARDIQPIFENSCLRCHGPERARSALRLDNREDALAGGEKGAAILPGDSARSPLIHYVAHLVPDMEMPPAGKGEPLSPDQIARLRAWIDQGAHWPETSGRSTLRFSLGPSFQWISVSGNERLFREHSWQREGWSGGAGEFELSQQIDADTRYRLEGRALANHDHYRVALELRRVDTGFITAGYQQFRKYYDDAGGYYAPFGLPALTLGNDLYLDTGKAWVNLGLALPNRPHMTIGYEYHFKDGVKSTLQWGGVTAGGTTKSIYPAFKEIHEQTHVFTFDLTHELGGVRMEDNFRGELHSLHTRRQNGDFITFDVGSRYIEDYSHFVGANTLQLERQVRDWLFLSGGYLYSHLSGEGSFQQITFAPSTGAVFIAPSDFTPVAVLKSQSHVLNANTRLGPWEGLTFTAAAQNDWTRTRGFGNGSVFGFPRSAHTYNSDQDKVVSEGRFTMNYDRIPGTVLFAEARVREESIAHSEAESIADGVSTSRDYIRDTHTRADTTDLRGGFSVSPWTPVTFSATYRHREKSDDFNHRADTDLTLAPGNGYPGLLLARTERSDEIEARLAWRVFRWLRTTFKYERTMTDFLNVTTPAVTVPVGATPGGGLQSGDYNAHIGSLNFTLTPWARLYLNSSFSYSRTRQNSGMNDGVVIVPFEGSVWTVMHSCTFAATQKTDLTASYTFSKSAFGQSNTAALPLGLDYSLHGLQAGFNRRFKENIRGGLQYLFQHYTEAGTGGAYDYTAHGVFGVLTVALP